ncbi:hypothetical protein [Polaromonas sp. DSR2-3-2]|uniref:hypothetical protein n=1 Tax=unclassified Polaromonas TaxID=2638319 RepID=UPI003CF0A099
MKSGPQNKIRSAPPMRSPAEALAGLDKVREWTEQPAKDAASAITPVAEVIAPVEPPKAPEARFPWDEAAMGAPEAVKLVNFKIPMRLYLKLKYLGDTTYDSSMTKIVVSTLEKETDRLLKARQA